MDPVPMVYYAAICGLLGVAAPRLRRFPVRFGVGVGVGLAAAGLLPVLRRWLGV
jgi:hypothetical protein